MLGKDLNSILTNRVQPTLFYCTQMMMSSKSPVTNLLLDTSGSLRMSPSKESSKDSGLVSSHGSFDIFCGRGIGFFDHPGNQRMLHIVQRYKAQYQTASKAEKTSITQNVVQIIQNTGDSPAKFLKQIGADTDATWYELGDKEVHKKIAHSLRENKTTIKSCKESIQVRAHKRRKREADISDDLPQTHAPKSILPTRTRSSDSIHPNLEKESLDILTMVAHLSDSPNVSVFDDEASHHPCQGSNEEDGFFEAGGEPLSSQQESLLQECEFGSLFHAVLGVDEQADDLIFRSFLEDLGPDMVVPC
jgi:hypothetical protein